MIKKIQNFFSRLLGVESRLYKLEEYVDALHFYLNEYCIDIYNLPETSDTNLLIMQKCDVMLVAIIDKFCQKHNLTYWMDYGTLLGAIRHKGFIPWDDDVDLSMPRQDYQKFFELFKNEVADDFITIEYKDGEPLKSYGIGYRHEETGIWCDIFPFDTYYSNNVEFKDAICDIKTAETKWTKHYNKVKNQKSQEQLYHDKTSYFNFEKGHSKVLTSGKEFPHNHPNGYFSYDEIFPIRRILFGGFKFCAPNKEPEYISKCISNSWDRLPLTGLFHHDEGRGALSTWALKNGIDMNQILEELKLIYNKI